MNSAETSAVQSPTASTSGNSFWVLWLLLLLLGIGCRFYGLNWDDHAQLHPDERFCVSLVPRLALPTSLSSYFDSSTSPLNPANLKDVHYVYGQLPLFICKGAGALLRRSDGDFFQLGRFLSALFDCGTILFTFLIARRLLNWSWAIFAASLVAGAALHIQQSHFFVTDPFAACFLTASFWAGTRLIQRQKQERIWPDSLLWGTFFGAALACKISAALFGVALLGFLFLFARKNGWQRTLNGAIWCLLATVIAFRVGHPMAFRGELWGGFFDLRLDPRFWDEVKYQGAITRGLVDVPFNVQWVGRTPWLFSLRNLGGWGYGWLFLLSAGAGLIVALRRPRGQGVLLVGALFGLVLLGIQGAAFSKFTRYFLPLTPFLAILAAYFWREVTERKIALRFGAPVVALATTLWGLSVASIYGRPHTRIQASQWIVANIAPGTVVANETPWDEGLPLLGVGGLNGVSLDSFDLDTPDKRTNLATRLDAAEWIFLSSGRSWQDIPRWSEKWPMTTEFYRALFDGRLGFKLEKRFTSFPQLGPVAFPDAGAEEAITVYDHPMVMLFRKSKSYDGAKTRAILDRVVLPENQNWTPKEAPKPDERALPLPPSFGAY